MFDVVLTLDCILDGLESFEMDEPFRPISSGKTFDKSGAMFKYSTDEVVCYADVKNAVRTICKDVNITTRHVKILQDVDGRDKPGHDERRK